MKVYILFRDEFNTGEFLKIAGVYQHEFDAINDRNAFGLGEYVVREYEVIQ